MPGYLQLNGALDQRDIVWPTLQVLKQKYLADMEELYVLMTAVDTQVLSADHARKFNLYKEIVRRLLTYLRVTRENLPLEFRENLLDSFAEQIVTIIEIFRKKPDRDDVAPATSFSRDRRQEGMK
jgi:hypothetical protein